jgi:hypothetical protein
LFDGEEQLFDGEEELLDAKKIKLLCDLVKLLGKRVGFKADGQRGAWAEESPSG